MMARWWGLPCPLETNELYYYDRLGRVFIITNFPAPIHSKFLDVSDVNRATGDGGFLWLTFHPRYNENRYLYTFCTHEHVEWKDVQPSFEVYNGSVESYAGLRDSEQILFDMEDESSVLHNGGDLHFGPDGYLYVTMGDEGAQLDDAGEFPEDRQGPVFRDFADRRDNRPGSLAPNPHPAINPSAYRIPPTIRTSVPPALTDSRWIRSRFGRNSGRWVSESASHVF